MNFRKISTHALRNRNEIFRRQGAINFDWQGESWIATLAPCNMVRDNLFCMQLNWGTAQVFLRAGPDWIEELTRSILGDVAISALPELVMLALLETIFKDVSEQLEYLTKTRLSLVGCNCQADAWNELDAFTWRIDSGDKSVLGEIFVDSQGLESLSHVMQMFDEKPADENAWNGLPMPVRFSLGWLDLPASDFEHLAVRDVVLLDECWLREGKNLAVKLDRNFGFRADLDGATLIVTEGIMEMTDDTDEHELDGESSLDNIEVRLTFDLGERSLSFGELKALAPGYAFDLGRDPRYTVTIRANGKPVGEGELVEISGRIGVSILTLTKASQ